MNGRNISTVERGRELVAAALRYQPSDEMKFFIRLYSALNSTAIKVEAEMDAKKRQEASVVKRSKNLTDRDDWLRKQFADKRKENPKYSIEQFHNSLNKTRKFVKELRPNGKPISGERLRQILR